MSKEGEPRQFKSNPIQRLIAGRLKAADINYEVIGVENLDKIRGLLEQGASASFELNHPAYADYPTLAAIVLKEGVDDLMPRSRLVISDKYSNNLLLAVPIRAIGWSFGLNFVSVKSHRFGGDKKDLKMNAEALEKIREDAAGTIVVTAPEGTHSPNGEMQPARWGSVRWWKGRDYLVPVSIRGTERQWPGGLKKILHYIRKGRKEEKVTVIIGKPVPVEYMERVAETYAQGDPDDLKRFRVDFPMLLIANLHNEYEREHNLEQGVYTKGYYQEFANKLTEHPVTISLQKLSKLGEIVVKQEERLPEAFEHKKIRSWPALRFDPGLT